MLKMEHKREQCYAITRQQAKKEAEKPLTNTIEEKYGTILHKRNFDLIFHIIPTENNTLRDKIINKFGITQFSNTWHYFQNYNYAIIISNQFSRHIDETTKCSTEMLGICNDKKIETIAINIDYDAYRHYFFFKNTLADI